MVPNKTTLSTAADDGQDWGTKEKERQRIVSCGGGEEKEEENEETPVCRICLDQC